MLTPARVPEKGCVLGVVVHHNRVHRGLPVWDLWWRSLKLAAPVPPGALRRACATGYSCGTSRERAGSAPTLFGRPEAGSLPLVKVDPLSRPRCRDGLMPATASVASINSPERPMLRRPLSGILDKVLRT